MAIRHFLRDDDITADERRSILQMAADMKANRFGYRPLEGPLSVALIFDKPSTRTRVSFSVGVAELGGNAVVLEATGSQLGRGETPADTARSVGRQVSAIVWRTFFQTDLEELAAASAVPVVNSLSDTFHPCQILSDLLTIHERFGKIEGLTIAFLGDSSNNMAHSYLLGCADMGMHVRLAGPNGNVPNAEIFAKAEKLAAKSGGSVQFLEDAKQAAYGADVIATDTWESMGQGSLTEDELRAYAPFQANSELMSLANPNAVVFHCLPAHREQEITSEVLDGPQSGAWDQAENRLHVQKALLQFLLQN